MARCNEELRAAGVTALPRSCQVHGLGPCPGYLGGAPAAVNPDDVQTLIVGKDDPRAVKYVWNVGDYVRARPEGRMHIAGSKLNVYKIERIQRFIDGVWWVELGGAPEFPHGSRYGAGWVRVEDWQKVGDKGTTVYLAPELDPGLPPSPVTAANLAGARRYLAHRSRIMDRNNPEAAADAVFRVLAIAVGAMNENDAHGPLLVRDPVGLMLNVLDNALAAHEALPRNT